VCTCVSVSVFGVCVRVCAYVCVDSKRDSHVQTLALSLYLSRLY